MKYILYAIGILFCSAIYKALGDLAIKSGITAQIIFTICSILVLAYCLYRAGV